jgi:ABC-2 type transport system ATP-binding protein
MAHISMKNVCLDYPIYGHEPRLVTKKLISLVSAGKIVQNTKIPYVRSVDNLTLEVKSGERIGLIGNNGAGKTTILKLISGIYTPSSGTMEIDGNVNPILGSGFGLDEEATGYENIILGGIALGRSVKEMQQLTPEIAEFTKLGEFLSMPFKTYSAGMKARLAFAITTSFESEILAIDEGIGAGDKDFNDRAENRLDQFMTNAKIMILASHSNDLIKKFCTHTLVMKGGKQLFYGKVEDGLRFYMEEYS